MSPWWLLAAIAAPTVTVTVAVLTIGATIGATHRRRTGGQTAPGDGHQTPAPGQRTTRYEAASPPTRPTPAPGLTPEETTLLHYLHTARTWRPGPANAAREVADSLRQQFPHVDDTTLGRIVLELHGYTLAAAVGIPDQRAALCMVADVFGLTAEDLTHWARVEEVRFDQP